MRYAIVILFLLMTSLFSAEAVDNDDCIESLENEIIGIIYKNAVKEKPIADMTGRINETFDRKCDPDETNVKSSRKDPKVKACVRKLEDQIIQLINSSANNGDKEELVRHLVKNISENFEECKSLESKD